MRWRRLRLAAGLGLLAALFLVLDPRRLAAVAAGAAPGWLAAAAGCVAAATLVGGANLHLLVNRRGEIPLRRFLPLYWTAWAVGLAVPGQVGDLVSLTALLRRHGLAWHDSLGRSLLDKALSFGVVLALAAVALLPYAAALPVWLAATALLPPLVWLLGKLELLRGWRARAARAIAPVLAELAETRRRHPWRLFANFLLSWVKVGLTGLSYWCVFRALGYAVAPVEVLPPMAASALVAYLPITLNGLGTAELTGVALFAAIGLPPEGVLAAYLLLRVTVYLLAWLPVGLRLLARP